MCDSCQKDWDATRVERDRLREALRIAAPYVDSREWHGECDRCGARGATHCETCPMVPINEALGEAKP